MPQPDPSGRPPTLDAVIGLWTLVQDDGPGTCQLALGRLPVADGFGVHIERCSLPEMEAVKNWRLTTAGFELLDAKGATVMSFRQTDVDAFVATDRPARLERTRLAD